MDGLNTQKPSIDEWIKEAKQAISANDIGMYLIHNGVVRKSAKAKVRLNDNDALDVTGMDFDFDDDKVKAAIEEAKQLEGIYYVGVWLNRGHLQVGDDIMYVIIGGDIRPHVIDALQALVGKIKTECVVENELH